MLVLMLVNPLNTAMIGTMTGLLCLVHAASLLVRHLSPSSSACLWTSEAASAGVMATAILYVTSHVFTLVERRVAWSQPQLHRTLVTRL